MIGTLKDLTINRDQTQNITITVDSDFREMFDKLKDVNIEIEIKKHSKHRSQEANSYLWHLCSEIAKASSKFSTDGKNDIYKEAIRAKGEWVEVKIPEEDVQTFVRRWTGKGIGWFVDVIDDLYEPVYDDVMGDTLIRRKTLHAYYGSSTYDTATMSNVIDYVVNIASDLGISTMTENEYEKMMLLWSENYNKTIQKG